MSKTSEHSAFSVHPDRGAHFYKCDFQVHTPRDANWAGEYSHATSLSHRSAFARALIADARKKGLDALAITDHHDLCMWRYVQDAAAEEQRAASQNSIIVFPGVELTLSNPPCQALLILDPSLPDEALSQIWGALGITPIPNPQGSCGDPTPLRSDLDLNAIYRVLSGLSANPEETVVLRREPLAQRFIVLPHVNDKGHKTLLRRGNYRVYSEMMCVGGYIEGCFFNELSRGNQDKLEGRSIEWGNKALGVFQTSDSRRAVARDDAITFPDLGQWPTWVKWTEPSAEALRQACLAHDSRISHSEPTFPQLRLLGVEVSNSAFLGPCILWLNPQFTSFIGGRGTGKSSLLEYIRWGLCDDPLPTSMSSGGFDELPDFQKRRKSLIEKTLQPSGAVVNVYYEKFGVTYRISRSSTDAVERVMVTSSDGTSHEMRGEQVRKEFPIIAYAQKQLSIVGTLPDEVRRLVTDPIRERLANIEREISENALPALKAARHRWVRVHQLESHILETKQQLESKTLQITSLRSGVADLAPEDSATISTHDEYRGESTWIAAVESSIEVAHGLLAQAGQIADTKLRYLPYSESWPHHAEIVQIAGAVDKLRSAISTELHRVLDSLDQFPRSVPEVAKVIARVKESHKTHEHAYRESLSRAVSNERQLEDLRSLEVEASEVEKRMIAFSDEVETLLALDQAESTDPWELWTNLHDQRRQILEEQALLLSRQAENAFRVTIRPCASVTTIRSKLQLIVNCGRNIRGSDEKIRALAERVVDSSTPLQEWVNIIDDFRLVAEARGASVLPSTKYLSAAGFTDSNLASLRDGVEVQLLEDLRYVPLVDEIVFEFTFGTDTAGLPKYIPFQDASPGQQATALLKALLGQHGPPLLIDQPEEDLDNEQVNVIADYIRRTKHHRQLLFVSHNANLVVNGDAELVACFGYRIPGDQTAATVIQEGSIDYAPVRELVTSVMEGGRAAFDLRRQKYNF